MQERAQGKRTAAVLNLHVKSIYNEDKKRTLFVEAPFATDAHPTLHFSEPTNTDKAQPVGHTRATI